MRRNEHRVPKADGFTIIEVLVAMAIVGVVMGAIYNVFNSSNRSYHTQERVADAQQRVRTGVSYMARDIRMAGFDPTGGGNAGVEVATATKLRFTADMNRANGIEDIDRERITYEYDAANSRLRQCLYEGSGSEAWQTLIDDVNALTFTYLDPDDNTIAAPVAAADLANIKTVVVSLNVQGNDAKGNTFSRALSSRVICRNLNL